MKLVNRYQLGWKTGALVTAFLAGAVSPIHAAPKQKVKICHVAGGSGNVNLIEVAQSAANAHIRNHGDTAAIPFFEDFDGDGFAAVDADSVLLCEGEGVFTSNMVGDCDDDNASVNPSASEIIGNGLDDDCDPTTPDTPPSDCANGAEELTRAPGGLAVVCNDASNATCEQDMETLCPADWHLCSDLELNNRNDGWNYAVSGGAAGSVLGEIFCRSFAGAGHFTLGPYDGYSNLSQDAVKNCGYGSSRDSCTATYGCNETAAAALCCAPSPQCGNGVVDSVEEECDDGNSDETDACLNSCSFRVPSAQGLSGAGCG